VCAAIGLPVDYLTTTMTRLSSTVCVLSDVGGDVSQLSDKMGKLHFPMYVHSNDTETWDRLTPAERDTAHHDITVGDRTLQTPQEHFLRSAGEEWLSKVSPISDLWHSDQEAAVVTNTEGEEIKVVPRDDFVELAWRYAALRNWQKVVSFLTPISFCQTRLISPPLSGVRGGGGVQHRHSAAHGESHGLHQ